MSDPRARVAIVGLGDVGERSLRIAETAVRRHLGLEVVDRRWVDPDTIPATAREADPNSYGDSYGDGDSYDAFSLARVGFECSNAPRCLTVTDREVRHEGTPVFGIAEVGGRAATVATEPLAVGAFADDPDGRFAERVGKQAVCHAGRLLGMEECGDDACIFSRSPTIHDVDAENDGPCADCRNELAGLGFSPGEGQAITTADVEAVWEASAKGETEQSDPSSLAVDVPGTTATGEVGAIHEPGYQSGGNSGPPRAPDRGQQGPGDARPDPGWGAALKHDLVNTGRFVKLLVGAGVSFVLAILFLTPVIETVAGSWSDLGAQVLWVSMLAVVVLTYIIYRVVGWLVGRVKTRVVRTVRSRV